MEKRKYISVMFQCSATIQVTFLVHDHIMY